MKKFVFIESNTSGTGRHFVHEALELGFEPVMLVEDPARYPYLHADGIAHIHLCTGLHDALVAELERLQKENGIAAIYSTSDHFIAVASEMAALHGLPGAGAAAIRRCRDKYEQRRQLKACGVKVPGFWRVQSIDEFEELCSHLRLPLIVKPVCGTGSVDVRLCCTQPTLALQVKKLLSTCTNERGIAITPEALIEEYVAGDEYSVETFNERVIGITRKHLSPEPHFVETGHDFPAQLPPETAKSIASTAVAALRALNLGFGPAHTEIRFHPDRGPFIIEVNPRLAGGFIPWLVKAAIGVDLIRATVALVSGQPVDLEPTSDQFASIRFLVAEDTGTLENIEGLERAKAVPGIAHVQLYRQSGASITRNYDFRDRIGHIIGAGSTAEAAAGAASSALSEIKVMLRSQLEAVL